MTEDCGGAIRHRLVAPDMPDPSAYLPLLLQMHRNGWYSNFGPLVRRFEAELLAAFGLSAETCVTCSSATAGLSAALLASGRKGPVLLPAFTFPASLGAVRAAGMTPIVVDANVQTWMLDENLLDEAFASTGADAAMLVAPFGIGGGFEAHLDVCRKWKATVIIDNAAGLGGRRGANEPGDDLFEVFSLHATKPFAVGEGGAVFAHRNHDSALRSALNFALASHDRACGPAWGFNGKMSELHAAVGIAQLDRYASIVRERQAFVALYQQRLAGLPDVVCPADPARAPWQVFPALLPSGVAAQTFIDVAAASGLEIRRYYRPSLSRWPQTERFGDCPVSEDFAERMCVLPVRPLHAFARAESIAETVMASLETALTACGSARSAGRRG